MATEIQGSQQILMEVKMNMQVHTSSSKHVEHTFLILHIIIDIDTGMGVPGCNVRLDKRGKKQLLGNASIKPTTHLMQQQQQQQQQRILKKNLQDLTLSIVIMISGSRFQHARRDLLNPSF